jgi:glycosyltransferase involved in cell wall biosynthesis
MRIAFVTWRDTTHPDGGGSEVYVEEVARRLATRGHDVTIVCARHGDAAADELVDGVRLVRVGGRLTVYPRALAWLARHRVDVVVDVINGLPFGTPLVRRRGVVGLVHHLHQRQWQIIYPGLAGRLGWWVESRLTPRLYRGVPHLTVSEASRRDLAGLGVGDVTVARNGLVPAPAPRHRSPEPRLCVLARLVPHKQIEHAVAVAVSLQDEFPGVHLDVVGEGWWRDELEREVTRLGAREIVTLHGHVDQPTRDQLLAQAWVMLLPSVKEGWGLAVMEAAAQGTPTVAYREAGGVTESVVDGETGRLVDDLAGMEQATRGLLRNPWTRQRMAERARERALTFDWESTTDVVERVLTAASAPRHRRVRA